MPDEHMQAKAIPESTRIRLQQLFQQLLDSGVSTMKCSWKVENSDA
jgi:hypothetical protein